MHDKDQNSGQDEAEEEVDQSDTEREVRSRSRCPILRLSTPEKDKASSDTQSTASWDVIGTPVPPARTGAPRKGKSLPPKPNMPTWSEAGGDSRSGDEEEEEEQEEEDTTIQILPPRAANITLTFDAMPNAPQFRNWRLVFKKKVASITLNPLKTFKWITEVENHKK